MDWSEDYVNNAKRMFGEICEEMYEEKFVDKIYKNNVTLVSKKEFVEAIAGRGGFFGMGI